MNTKKKIFFIIAGVLAFFIILLILSLNGANERNKQASKNFSVWVVGDDKEKTTSFLNEFKKVSGYSFVPSVESFNSWEEYNLALASAIVRGEAPDVFVLNNNEKSLFLENVKGIDPKTINPDSFIDSYEQFFGEDLVISSGEGENKVNFLIGVPVGYETLGLYYNRLKGIQADDVTNWASLNSTIQQQKKKHSNTVPLGIGRGTTVEYAGDIATQFFMLEGETSLEKVNGASMKTALSSYFLFSDEKGQNGYDSKFENMLNSGKNNLDLFSRGEISMVFGYPRTIFDIDEKGFRKKFLYAKPFPGYYVGGGKALVNYNYFVLNKNSVNSELGLTFLSYLRTEEGARKYLEKFPYYLPGLISLREDLLDKEILEGYNVKLKDFYNEALEMSSFDKGIKSIYDKNIISVLDDSINYIDNFDAFRDKLVCVAKKVISLKDLSKSCNKE